MTQHTRSLLVEAKNTIRQLRNENQLLSAQIRIVEIFGRATAGVSRDGSMSIDLTWEIEQHLQDNPLDPSPANQEPQQQQ